jgi:hypothetical protein
MTFFYDLNKRLAELAKKQTLAEGFAQEGNAFSGAVAKAKADGVQPGEKIRVGGKEYPVKEDDVDDFIKAGGKITYGKPQKGPRKPGLSLASKHIGGSGDKMKPSRSGRGASTQGKPVVAVEDDTPMTPKQKSFAKLAPPANKITFADKIAGAKKEVDEMLGDVAAEAIKSAIQKKEPRSKGTAFDPEVAKGMFAGEKGKTKTGHEVKDTGYSKRYTKQLSDEPDTDDEVKSDGPKVKGRPKGSKRAIGAKGPTGKSKLMSKGAIKETDVDEDYDKDEYDEEGEMAKSQSRTIADAAKELQTMIGDNENLPEWVQKKINLAKDYIDAARDYLKANRPDDDVVAEKAVSKKQQKFMGMAHAMQKGEKIKGASPELKKVAKTMKKGDVEDFAKTKHKGLPEKKKKDKTVDETTTAGSVATAPAEKKSSGGYNFGGGVYESLDRKFRQALNEGMNVSVNMSTGQNGEPTKNITISADGEDADRLADLLKMAGIQGSGEESCKSCGQTPCGCESLEENSPDWPTNTETSDDAMQYSGGLNGPKSTGQTTTPVIASQLRRQVSMEEGVKIERSLLDLYQTFKTK